MTSPIRSAPKFTVPLVKTQQYAELSGGSNDPRQRATVSGSSVRIIGDGMNNGFVPSALRLNVDGKQLSIPISRGQTPQQTQELIARALPAGYSIQNIPTLVAIDGVWFNIAKNTTTVDMDKAMSMAQEKGSFAGQKLSVVELKKIVTELQKDGFSADEKEALARGYAGLFTGADWNATKAAQKEYARIAEKFELPVIPVR